MRAATIFPSPEIASRILVELVKKLDKFEKLNDYVSRYLESAADKSSLLSNLLKVVNQLPSQDKNIAQIFVGSITEIKSTYGIWFSDRLKVLK